MENTNKTGQVDNSAEGSLVATKHEPLYQAAQKILSKWRTMIAENDFRAKVAIVIMETAEKNKLLGAIKEPLSENNS